MKFTKKCDSTQHKISKRSKLDKRRSSAGMFYTSSAGAVTSLILMFQRSRQVLFAVSILILGLIANLMLDLNYSNKAYGAADYCRSFELIFYANGGTGGPTTLDTGTMAESSTTYDFIIPTSTPVRPGYNFLGWSEYSESATADYQPGDTYTSECLGEWSVESLYAVWEENSYTLSMTSSGAQEIDVAPGNSGIGTRISTDAVAVTTTCPSGYYLTTTTSVNNNKLYLGGSSSASSYLSASNGTTALINAANTWGFYQNGSTVPTSSSVFKAVPASTSSAATIRTGSSSGTDSFNIYYGVAVGDSLSTGSYTMIPDANNSNKPGTIRYYLTLNENCIPYIVSFNANGGSGSMPSQQIMPNIATPLTANSFTAPSGKEFKEWNTKADGTGTSYSDQQSVTNLASGGGSITLYAIWYVPPTPLYNLVAAQSKGTQTLAELRAAITTSNSGVYEYDSSSSGFGPASDASSDYPIYYYRGILDNTVGTYGSDGDNEAWPNTVLLDTTGNGKDTTDTCWRIVRTTGSGGVKMIYQGKWTSANGCKNSSTNANAVSDVYFNRRSTSSTNNYGTTGRIIYVGYNFSSNSSHQTSTSSVSNSDLFVNGTQSNLRTQLESWYNSNMTAWTSKLEGSAGWCNDRTTYSSTSTSSKTTSNVPYKTSSATANFGAYIRNATTNSQPTLGCPNDTGYDLLTTSNGYIGVPSAPLTADEAAFAGSGDGSYTTPYHANSYLRSGDYFWLLSPTHRYYSGGVRGFGLGSGGNLYYNVVSIAYGVRPSISLKPGTTAVSGTGTAADPWIVNPNFSFMQNMTVVNIDAECPAGVDTSVYDSRDNKLYTVRQIDGQCIMTKNLAYVGGAGGAVSPGNAINSSGTSFTMTGSTSASYTSAYYYDSGRDDYGVYYNYCAASGKTICTSSDSSNATVSICPSHWSLPVSDTNSWGSISVSSISSSSAFVARAGVYSNGTLYGEGTTGSWWSQNSASAANRYRLLYSSNSFNAQSNIDKQRLMSVRCVLSE